MTSKEEQRLRATTSQLSMAGWGVRAGRLPGTSLPILPRLEQRLSESRADLRPLSLHESRKPVLFSLEASVALVIEKHKG